MLIRWKYGSTTWVPLKDMKESYPVQLSEYAVLTRIQEEPAFAWRVPPVLWKRNRIVAKVKSKYWIRTHKNWTKGAYVRHGSDCNRSWEQRHFVVGRNLQINEKRLYCLWRIRGCQIGYSDWISVFKLPYDIWHQDGQRIQTEGLYGRWRSHDISTSISHLLICFICRLSEDCIDDCCFEWIKGASMRHLECLLEC